MYVEGCLFLRKGFGNKVNCIIFFDGYEVCLVFCCLGYVFLVDKKLLLVYVCGFNILYIWNGVLFFCGCKLLVLFMIF